MTSTESILLCVFAVTALAGAVGAVVLQRSWSRRKRVSSQVQARQVLMFLGLLATFALLGGATAVTIENEASARRLAARITTASPVDGRVSEPPAIDETDPAPVAGTDTKPKPHKPGRPRRPRLLQIASGDRTLRKFGPSYRKPPKRESALPAAKPAPPAAVEPQPQPAVALPSTPKPENVRLK